MKKILILFTIALTLIITSCKKPAGEGGNSTITGKIHTTNYNSTFTVVNAVYDSPDQDVYIIYGDDATYGNKTKTGPDGVFEFKYLRKGNYKIYVYSKDKAAYLPGINPPDVAVYKEGEITAKKQTVDFGTIEIIK
ncbi:MAG: hypothetical protein NTX97_02525 [Bacteroidetes bacterium]|nr:hypothetical protein [Bacteroidota bacterium]